MIPNHCVNRAAALEWESIDFRASQLFEPPTYTGITKKLYTLIKSN